MEKTVGEIGIQNSDLFSDQYFFQCIREPAIAGTPSAVGNQEHRGIAGN